MFFWKTCKFSNFEFFWFPCPISSVFNWYHSRYTTPRKHTLSSVEMSLRKYVFKFEITFGDFQKNWIIYFFPVCVLLSFFDCELQQQKNTCNLSSALSDTMKIDFPVRTNILKCRENLKKIFFLNISVLWYLVSSSFEKLVMLYESPGR